MKTFNTFMEDLASGRPIKKPVSSNLLQQRAKANTKAMKSGFMKLTKQERDKEARRMSEAKDMCSCNCDCGKAICESCGKPKMQKESARDNYDPVISDKRTKEKLKKAGLPPESPKVMEQIFEPIVEGKKKGMDGKACWKGYKLQGTKKKGNRTVDNCVPMSEEEEMKPHKMYKGDKVIVAKNKAEHDKLNKQGYTHDDPKTKKVDEARKPVVHSTKPDSLKKMVKIKLNPNKKIGVKITDIGPGGKEYVRKNTMKEQQIQLVTNLDFNESIGNLVSRGLDKVRTSIKDAEKRTGLSVDASKNNKNNPVSGKNIAKRLASQKKR